MYLAAFDTETGGLDPSEQDLLTFYMAILDEDLKILDEIDLKLKPNDRLPITTASAMEINKIDLKRHLEDPETLTYSDGKERLVTFLNKYHKKTGKYNNLRPLGQNVDFDIQFTQHHLLPKSEWDKLFHYGKVDTKQIVDFLKDCTFLPERLGSLITIVEHFGIPKRNAHSAKDDTLMMIDVYKTLIALMKSKKDGGQSQDLISLLEAE